MQQRHLEVHARLNTNKLSCRCQTEGAWLEAWFGACRCGERLLSANRMFEWKRVGVACFPHHPDAAAPRFVQNVWVRAVRGVRTKRRWFQHKPRRIFNYYFNTNFIMKLNKHLESWKKQLEHEHFLDVLFEQAGGEDTSPGHRIYGTSWTPTCCGVNAESTDLATQNDSWFECLCREFAGGCAAGRASVCWDGTMGRKRRKNLLNCATRTWLPMDG